MAIINYNTDVSQFWEWSGRGRPFVTNGPTSWASTTSSTASHTDSLLRSPLHLKRETFRHQPGMIRLRREPVSTSSGYEGISSFPRRGVW
jgi:hypothetical protein